MEHTRTLASASRFVLLAAALLGTLVSCVPNPNFPSETRRAEAAGEVLRVHVKRDGTILMNDVAVSLDQLRAELKKLAARKGVVRYSRDNPAGEPPPNAMAVLKAITDENLRVQIAMPAH